MAEALSHATPTRDLTPEEVKKLQTLAYKVESVAVRACTDILNRGIDLAEALYLMKEQRLWQVLNYESHATFLAALPIKFSESHAYKLIRVYREFCIDRGVPKEKLKGADLENLQIALPAVKEGKADPIEVAAHAKELSRSDMIAEYREGEPGRKIDPEAEPRRHSCPECGHFHVVKEQL